MYLIVIIELILIAQLARSQSSGVCSGPESYRQTDGGDYRGYVNITVSGIACQAWDTQWPQVHSTQVPDVVKGIGEHNYCRLPTGSDSVGCYTTDPEVRFEHCDIGLPCTAPITQAQNSLSFSPSSGEILSDSVVTLTCAPKPCEVFYTSDGTAPTATSLKYNRPVSASLGPFTIKTFTVFADGSQHVDASSYVGLAKSPSTVASLYPSADVIYATPVLVSVLTTATDISVYLQNDTTPRTYSGPFWIYATTSIVVVVGDNVMKATYQVATSPRLPSYYPSAGTYFGSVTIVFIPTVTREVFYVRINGAEWKIVEEVTISTIGTNLVEIQSVSVDKPSSAVVSATYIVAPKAPPSCNPPSGTYNTSITLECRIGNSSIPVTKMCNGSADSSLMTCNESSSLFIGTPGSFIVTASYTDTYFNTILEMFTYTLVPVEMSQPTVVPCGGFFANSLIVSASTNETAEVKFIPVDGTSTFESLSPIQSLLTTISPTPSSVPFNVTIHSKDPMKATPSRPKQCSATLYPGATLPTSWFRIPLAWNTNGTLKATIAKGLLLGNTNLLEFSVYYNQHFLIRMKTHPAIARAYTRRLYNVLSTIVAMKDIQSSDGVLPIEEVRNLPNAQNISTEERSCGQICQGTSITPICNCSEFTTLPTFGLVSSYSLSTMSPTVARPVNINLQWIGFEVSFEAKAVLSDFGCSDLGIPLRKVLNSSSLSFSPRYEGLYSICVDEGRGFHSTPSLSGLLRVVSGVVQTPPTLSPCGGTFSNAITINVVGQVSSSYYSLNSGAWVPLPTTIKLPMQSYGSINTVSVASEFVDQLTGISSTTDIVTCVYQFDNSPAAISGLTYNYERTTALVENTRSKITEARIRIGILGSKTSDFSVFVSDGPNCGNLSSYVSKSDTLLRADRHYLLAASVNQTKPYTVCAAYNADMGNTVQLAPSGVALSPLSILVNRSCGTRCGASRVCIGEFLCGCTASNGTLYLCDAEIPQDDESTSIAKVILVIVAITLPAALGLALFYGITKYTKNAQKH